MTSTKQPPSAEPARGANRQATAAQGHGPLRQPAGDAAPPPALGDRKLLVWMFGFLRPVRGQVLLACLYLILACAAEVLIANQAATAIDAVRDLNRPPAYAGHLLAWLFDANPLVGRLRWSLLLLIGVTLAYLILRYLRIVQEMRLSMTMVYHIRAAVYDKLQRVGFAFHDALSSGQLINRALSDLQNVRLFVQTSVIASLEIALIVGGYIALIGAKSALLAVLALLPLPLWTWYILRLSRQVQPVSKAVMEAEDKNVTIITENIAGVHVVKAFANEESEQNRFNANCDHFMERVLKRVRLFANFTPIIRIIACVSYLSLFLTGGIFMLEGKLDVGSLLILGAAMGAIFQRLQTVATINEQYQNAMVSARRLFEVLEAAPSIGESRTASPLPPGPGAVRFDRVTFGYDPSKPSLHDVSFEARGGSIVAIVGPTGAGKSTLVNLLARFYDPQSGRVLIDGVDTRDATLGSVRGQVSFVFQETFLFSETVAGNIAYGRPNISDGEIEAAARLAQAHEFIEALPRGYQTMLGERGASLSGGQRQRLAIARAIVANPRILVLDDATASIDPRTEDLIRRAMEFVMYGRTTFIIAHRISTVKRADLVLVLERGRLAQAGTHAELMAAAGHYRDIAVAQLTGDDADIAAGANAPSHMDRLLDPQGISPTAGREAHAPGSESQW